MAQRVRVARNRSAETVEREEPSAAPKASETKALTTELLDEIDELLEENAADFVRDYVQQGGQ